MYTFSFVVGNIMPTSVKCIHSATKIYHSSDVRAWGLEVIIALQGIPGQRLIAFRLSFLKGPSKSLAFGTWTLWVFSPASLPLEFARRPEM